MKNKPNYDDMTIRQLLIHISGDLLSRFAIAFVYSIAILWALRLFALI